MTRLTDTRRIGGGAAGAGGRAARGGAPVPADGRHAFATGQADGLPRLFDVSSPTVQSRGTGQSRGKTSFQPES